MNLMRTMKARTETMDTSITKELTPSELRELVEEIPEGTVISIELKVVLENG